MTAYLVGSDNPNSPDPDKALDPRAPGSAGERLLELSGMTLEEYERAFRRVNACDSPVFDVSTTSVVVLGRRAWKALMSPHGVTEAPEFFSSVTLGPDQGVKFTLLPHPSGKNRMYNAEANRRRAGEMLREAAGALDHTQ